MTYFRLQTQLTDFVMEREREREERASVFGMNCQNHPRNDEKNQTRARSIARLHNQMHRKSIKKTLQIAEFNQRCRNEQRAQRKLK